MPPLCISITSYFVDVILRQAMCALLSSFVSMLTLTERLLVSIQDLVCSRLPQFKTPNSNEILPSLALFVRV